MKPYFLLPFALAAALPTAAEVIASNDTSLTVRHKISIAAPPAKVWATLIAPSRWWDGEHSYSGDAANISIDARAGGCWCEKMPGGGSIEHMRVLYVQPGKTIRFTGGLGPLQAMPVNGVMTVTLASSDGKSTEVTLDYAVAGAPGLAPLAAPVDRVLGEQMLRLKAAVER